MTVADVAAIRRGAGLFSLSDRALLEVTGGDRVRWLQGQISNDVETLAVGEGCYATALTVKGRIVADLHVLARDDRFWIETGAAVRDALWQRLDRYIVADDVELGDASDRFERLALEGAEAGGVLASLGAALPPENGAREARIAGCEAVVWAFGFSNEPAYQLLIPAGEASAVREALLAAGSASGLVEADAAALETLRIESGVPALGSELDEEVFPAEARLAHAISTTKGCYTGQEIVERIRSRGAVNYLLVGLRFDGALPAPGTELQTPDGKRVGEVTSVASSPEAGAIGLGYLRRELEAPGSEVGAGEVAARVVALPFVGPGPA
ncbi:MAG: folate-binding protein YgfZ [Deltaproteobacteria bacterium]|nr:folate-binding protein YgfZ [Deltaproteobacteria bacterium]MBW2447006.1 folate-binding protein YgfZ [Deltaproteobacteria bacterium]